MSGYIGTQPVPQSTQTRDSFTATSGQTSFATGGYQSGYIDLYLNGIKLAAADYTATNNSDVVLAVGAATGDILEVVAYTAFNTANVTGAVDFTVTGLFTSRGIDDNADATAITIDSSENVSLTGALDVTGAVTADSVRLNNTVFQQINGTDPFLSGNAYYNGSTWNYLTSSDATNYYQLGGTHVWRTAASGSAGAAITWSESMRINASQHLLIGKTADDNTTTGTVIHDNGFMSISRSANIAMILDRSSNEGEILRLTEAGTERGSLHINGDRMLIDSAGDASGLRFDAGSYTPFKNGSAANGTVDLGFSAGRFKDLFLSGGVYLGGTGAANKLSDVEGGAWVPVLSKTGTAPTYSAIGSGIGATYIKIGSSVTVWFDINYDMSNAGSGDAFISGLPFAPAVGVANGGYSEVGIRNSTGYNVAAGLPITGYVYLSRIYVEINQSLGTVAANFSAGNGLRVTGMCTYKTAA